MTSRAVRSAKAKVLAWAYVSLATACSGGGGQAGAPLDEPLVLPDRVVPVAELEQGRKIYKRLCVSCHGESGDGQGPAAKSLRYPPRDFRTGQFSFSSDLGDSGASAVGPTHEALVAAIREGAPDRGMPSWGALPAEDLDAVANYIKTFSPRWLRIEDDDLRSGDGH